MIFASLVVWLLALGFTATADNHTPAWGYNCEKNLCKKVELTDETIKTAICLGVCRLFCGEDVGTLWPKPTGTVKLVNSVMHIDPKEISFKTNFKGESLYWKEVEERFLKHVNNKLPTKYSLKNGGRKVLIEVFVESDDMRLTLDTKESYKVTAKVNTQDIYVRIDAVNFFGARHALETIDQLIVYDDIRNEVQMVADAEIADEPVFKYRGILLDTARNYFSVASIKRTLDAMAMVKLNTFHWHITDSHSFPLQVKSQPELTTLGAYHPDKIYTHEDVKEIVHYGKVRGIRVLPEFDAPAHVGEGWQNKNLTTCFNFQPWKSYCVEPPCGQLDPSKDEVYNVMEDIFREMQQIFEFPDLFHMGGDEVSVNCWNTSKSLQDWMLTKGWKLEESDFMKLWGYFQDNALARLDKVSKEKVPVIMWTSRLTEAPFLTQYLNKDRYIIQIWTKGDDPKVQTLLQAGYKLIISNYEALYLDCGFGGWVTDGNNWCSPYIGWQHIYDNRMNTIAAGEHIKQIYGAEAALWTEQVDEWALDSRLWPRASAMAERLWSDPKTGWKDAESRMLVNRRRLVQNGISAERLEPEWCLQNEGDCPI